MLAERSVYLNGCFVPESEAKISIFDRGFIYGDAAYDISRTYAHKAFRLDEYLSRFFSTLNYLRIEIDRTKEAMVGIIDELLKRNLELIGEDQEYTIVMRASRGSSLEGDYFNPPHPTLIVNNLVLDFKQLAKEYRDGVHIVVPSIRRTPSMCIDPRGKIQNKVNHILAEMEAKQVDPQAYCLMLDVQGRVAESSIANFFCVKDGVLMTPREENTLAGITRKTLLELSSKEGIPSSVQDLTMYDVFNADEAFLSSTTFPILAISRVNNRLLWPKVAGETTGRMIEAWKRLVGYDYVAQVMDHLGR